MFDPGELDSEQQNVPGAGNELRSFFVVPHTHWDREWYRPFEHFRLELAGVVDGVINVLERDPAFASFTLDGQAVVLEDYVDIRPENEGRLRALLRAGRIEVGPGYVLPDELLVAAESLVRNLLAGRAVCRRFDAEPTPVGYLPDSFGHPLQLPQILAGFGIGSFLFSRGLGDELDEVGVVFRWRAPDGSEVLAFQLLPHYDNFAALANVDDGETRIREIAERFGSALKQAGVHDLLLCNGSDHLPVQPELPAWCTELERRFPEGRFVIARYRDYVSAVEPIQVPVWTGELLGSRLQNVLRGVNSARLYLKQANERAERLLLAVETLAALRALHDGVAFPSSDFRLAWRELLRCQPHDSICGCSCDEVHRDMLVRYESLDRTLSELQHRALSEFGCAESPNSIGLFNMLPERRSQLIDVPGAEPLLIELDGFAARTVELTPVSAGRELDDSPSRPEGAAIENERFRIEAAPTGVLTVVDKRSGRRYEHFHALEDEPDMGDLYSFCPIDGSPVWIGEPGTVRVLAHGPLVWELEVRVEIECPAGLDRVYRALPETVLLSASTVVRLVRGSRRVEFQTTIENPARDHRLRAIFPVGSVAGPVRVEEQFAVVRRPLVPAQPVAEWVEPPDRTQHTLGAVALGPVALLTKGLPEYEVRSRADRQELCLTLIRCVGLISRPDGVLATRPRSAGPQVETPDGQCPGQHTLEYALLFDADALEDAALLREAHDYRCGFLAVPAGVRIDPALRLDGDVVFSCIKGAEDGDGLVLRCFNPAGSPAAVHVLGAVTVSRTRLDETGERPVLDSFVELGPGEIATLRLRLAARPTVDSSRTVGAMNDDWRLRVGLREEGVARELTDRLEASDLAHDLGTAFRDRVVVSRDGPEVFLYAGTREQAQAAERTIRSLAGEHRWQLACELRRWHPTAEEWEDPDEPMPGTDAERTAERAERIENERQESRAQGYPDYEVRVKCPSQGDARQLAEKLAREGIPCVHRWQFVVLGAPDEDSANALAERVRREAPSGSIVTAEGSVAEIVGDAPLATPFSPFSVFGGLGG